MSNTLRPPRITTSFVAETSDADLDLFASQMHISPSYIKKKGHPIPNRPNIVAPNTAWAFQLIKSESYSIDEELQKLLSALSTSKNTLLRWQSDQRASYHFSSSVLVSDENRPEYILSSATIRSLAEIGASWHIAIQ